MQSTFRLGGDHTKVDSAPGKAMTKALVNRCLDIYLASRLYRKQTFDDFVGRVKTASQAEVFAFCMYVLNLPGIPPPPSNCVAITNRDLVSMLLLESFQLANEAQVEKQMDVPMPSVEDTAAPAGQAGPVDNNGLVDHMVHPLPTVNTATVLTGQAADTNDEAFQPANPLGQGMDPDVAVEFNAAEWMATAFPIGQGVAVEGLTVNELWNAAFLDGVAGPSKVADKASVEYRQFLDPLTGLLPFPL